MKSNLFATDTSITYYKSPATELTEQVASLSLTEIPLQYSIGYASIDNIPHYHKLSKVEKTGNTYTISSYNKKENIDVMYLASASNTEQRKTLLTFVDDILTPVKISENDTVSYDVRFVNNANATETAVNYRNVYLSFYATGLVKNTEEYALYGQLFGLQNIIDFITGKTKLVNFVMGSQLSSSSVFTIPEISIDDFADGQHVYTFSDGRYTNTVKVWLAGIYYNVDFMPDTWDGKNWNSQSYLNSVNLRLAYCLTTDDNKKYISAYKKMYYPERTSYYSTGVLPNYYALDNIYNSIAENCIFTDINASITDGTYNYINYPSGNNWVYLNNSRTPRIYYCCSAKDIMHELAQIARALFDNDFIYQENPVAYTVNNSFCYPVVTENNEFTGNIVIPENANDIQKWQNSNNTLNTNSYDYETKPQYRPDVDSDFGDLVSNIGRNIQTVSTGKLYKIGISDANKVLNVIGGTYATDTLLSASDGLISFQYFPFNIPSANVSQTAKIGAYNDNGNIKGFPLPPDVQYLQVTSTSFMIDLGSTRINALYNDFRDFPPYTTYNAFIPFVNQSYTIDFAVFKNHTIAFKLIVDVLTGSSIVCIMRDGLLYDSINGTVATQISINSADVAQYNASIKATENAMQANELNAKIAMVNMISGLSSSVVGGSGINIGGAVSSVTGGLSAVANAALNRDMLQYQLDTMQVHYSLIQSASANCGNQLERDVHIIIAHAKMLPEYNDSIYAKTVGFACCKNDLMSNCTNFTQVSEINLTGINCTDVEKNLIKSALMQGVVIK